jgi:16S rRNA (adenine1518-N6/adenine1519-N6)-dimethyltransferase
VLLRTRERRELSPEEEPKFTALVKAAFAHRRKTLVNSLRDEGYGQKQVTDALIALNFSPIIRAEILSLAQFIELTRSLLRQP